MKERSGSAGAFFFVWGRWMERDLPHLIIFFRQLDKKVQEILQPAGL